MSTYRYYISNIYKYASTIFLVISFVLFTSNHNIDPYLPPTIAYTIATPDHPPAARAKL